MAATEALVYLAEWRTSARIGVRRFSQALLLNAAVGFNAASGIVTQGINTPNAGALNKTNGGAAQ